MASGEPPSKDVGSIVLVGGSGLRAAVVGQPVPGAPVFRSTAGAWFDEGREAPMACHCKAVVRSIHDIDDPVLAVTFVEGLVQDLRDGPFLL
jgi:hypothetical protein